MSSQITHGPVALKNVAAFMVLATQLIERDPHLPGIGVLSGYSGLGKSYSSIYAQNKTGAVRVEVGDSWTRRTLLLAILKEFGRSPRGRMAIADLAQEVIAALGDDPRKPLIIDEADKLTDKGMIEIVRELHEFSGAPVLLIGEEKLPSKLLAFERVHNRVLNWTVAQPCDFEDARLLADAFAPKIKIADDLLRTILTQSAGRARRIVVNVAQVGEFAKNKRLDKVDAAAWNGRGLYTGEPPQPRVVEPYKRKIAAVA
jgi:DNA transposition AAA+ family ATPase